MAKRRNKADINDYANAASVAGLTYGQKQSQEYAASVKIPPIPPEYQKAGEFQRKKWQEDL